MLPHPIERARSLFSEGRLSAALAVFGDSLPSDAHLALSCAEALSELGQTDRALSIATRMENGHPENPSILATARRIAGSICIDRGDRRAGIEYLRSAVGLAEAVGEHAEAARAALRLFSCAHSAAGRPESAEALGLVKRLVLRSNQPRLLADLYSRVGQAEAQSGNLRAAKDHLDRAVEILGEHAHHGVLARTKLALSSTLALLCRNDVALTEAKEALRAAETAGSLTLTRLCQANVAQLQFRTGVLGSARQNAEQLLASPGLAAALRLAVLETYVATLLEAGECHEGVPEVAEFLAIMTAQEEPSWVAVEAVPTQARVLALLRGPEAARYSLQLGRARSNCRDHTDSTCRLCLIEAEMLLSTGDVSNGESLIGEATALAGESPSIEIIGLLERARAQVAISQNERDAARIHFGRSERVLRGCGLRTEARRTKRLKELPIPVSRVASAGRSRRSQRALTAASEASYLASLAPSPRLLAAELRLAALRLGVARQAEVVAGPLLDAAPQQVEAARVYCGRELEVPISVSLSAVPDYMARQRLSTLMLPIAHAVQLAEATTRREGLGDFFELDVALGTKRGVYVSAPMRRLLNQIRQVARTELPVLVRGETGTGKEIVAEEVHALSRRSQGRFIPLNVTAVPRDTLEGQLFGYRRGAFTGAVSDAKGLIREAEGGTLFIDEIGEMSLDLQPKLLRFLESGEIQPLGERPQHVDVRIVAATNAQLDRLVREGRFREDLYYRLNVVSLAIPPLRERREEIPTLINHFLTQHARDAGKLIPQLSAQALERLSAYEWPGNVRQLTNELKRIVALHDENELVDVEHLSEAIRQPAPAIAPAASPPSDGTAVTVRLDQTLQGMYDDLERAAIPRAMRLARNNQTETAQRLGITRKGLYLKRRRLGLDGDDAA